MGKYKNLTLNDRNSIEKLYVRGMRVEDIANEIGKSRATVYHELKKGSTGEMDCNGRYGYSAELGQIFAMEAAHRKGSRKTVQV